MIKKVAIIIGAGPAGLTAGLELTRKTDVVPIILESSPHIGGISKTLEFDGNRIDLGGHRFFSKSEIVMDWWADIFPTEKQENPNLDRIEVSNKLGENSFLIRNRLSRIYYNKKFFNYPVTLSFNTLKNLGLVKSIKIGLSYIYIRLFPIKKEETLEDFYINRFGKELYSTFFEDYTEKVWGYHPSKIDPDWGSQRIKGVSLREVILNAVENIFRRSSDVSQKGTQTSLIQKFLYPKLGPGYFWEYVAKEIERRGGKILCNHKVTKVLTKNGKVLEVEVTKKDGTKEMFKGDFFFSSMAVRDLVSELDPKPPEKVIEVANGLMYRNFVTVGILANKLQIKNETDIKTRNNLVPDNWIYIQEPNVTIARIQIFNNWSPFMVKDKNKVWMGLEYMCGEDDKIWNKKDNEMSKFAVEELEKIGVLKKENVLKTHVVRMPKTYPAYFGTYKKLGTVKEYLNTLENLFPIGRNGMHRYNNQDHSMLSAMEAVKNIKENIKSKDNIWNINAEGEYHEK
ncbi:NAD(P)/FAD-dependent oxidoreductase [Patescibacteria group bacterium]